MGVFVTCVGGGRLRGTTLSQLRGTVVRIQRFAPFSISRPSCDASAFPSLWPLDAVRSTPQKRVESQGCLRTVVHRWARYCGHLALAPVLLPLLLPRAPPFFFLQRDSMTVPPPGPRALAGTGTVFTLGARTVILGVIVGTQTQNGGVVWQVIQMIR